MDVGIFKCGRWTYRLWILTPVVLIALVQACALVYCLGVNGRMACSQELLKLIPHVRDSRADVAVAIQRVLDACRGVRGVPEDVSRWVSELALSSEVTIKTLSVNSAPPVTTEMPTLTVTMRCQGRFEAILYFIGQVESSNPLVQVSGCVLVEERAVGAESYKCDLSFQIYGADRRGV